MAYGRVARVPLEKLIDDDAVLPTTLPGRFGFHTNKQRRNQVPSHPMQFLADILSKLDPS
jgi:hypothetical protein